MNALERWRNIKYEEIRQRPVVGSRLVCIMGYMDFDEVFGTAMALAGSFTVVERKRKADSRFGEDCEIEGVPCFCSHSFPYGIYFGGVRL